MLYIIQNDRKVFDVMACHQDLVAVSLGMEHSDDHAVERRLVERKIVLVTKGSPPDHSPWFADANFQVEDGLAGQAQDLVGPVGSAEYAG